MEVIQSFSYIGKFFIVNNKNISMIGSCDIVRIIFISKRGFYNIGEKQKEVLTSQTVDKGMK